MRQSGPFGTFFIYWNQQLTQCKGCENARLPPPPPIPPILNKPHFIPALPFALEYAYDGRTAGLADRLFAAGIAAVPIFRIVIIALITRLAAARSGSAVASSSARAVICHENPRRSLHHPHILSWPPLLTIAFHIRSVSVWSSVRITKLTVFIGDELRPAIETDKLPSTSGECNDAFLAFGAGWHIHG